MSEASSNHGVAELSLNFRGLRITVVGPAERAAHLLAAISELPFPDSRSTSADSFEVLEGVSSISGRLETRPEIEATFAPCPTFVLGSASRLGGAKAVAEQRIRRAYRAGQWARAVLDSRIATPSRTEQLFLRPRVYVVLRAPGISSPVLFDSSRDYWNCVGSLQDSSSVSHSFPSETEARAYCSGANIEFPSRSSQ